MGLESELDYRYFTNKNEIRQRIIPLVKEMYDNNMTPDEMYYLSPNLRQDSLFNIYSKVEIIYWLNIPYNRLELVQYNNLSFLVLVIDSL